MTPYATAPQDLYLFAFLGRPCNPGVSYYISPYALADTNSYDEGWDKDPWTIAIPGGITAGQRIWTKIVAQQGDTLALSTPGTAQCAAT
jgi:hypothetical protein